MSASPVAITQNLESLAAVILILAAGLVAISQMARHRVVGLIITIAGAALVYLALKGQLIPDVAGWFQQLGIG